MTWKDPPAAIAVLLVVILGAMLILGQTVPAELWTIASTIVAFFFGHVSALGGTGQVIKALNGSASASLTHPSPPADSSTPPAPASSSAPATPPTFGGTAPAAPADGVTA